MSEDPRPSTPPLAGVAPTDQDALPPGTRFGEFEVIRVLGVGGFGIVYLARDHSLERLVAIKEYMPATLAARGVVPLVTIRSSALAETYAIGLRSFVNEARLLARFDHPSLVKVYRFWEGNGTAYMVMPYLNGRTLRDVRRSIAESPSEKWLRSVLDPMLDALDQLHREGVFHRDIAPDNILLPESAPPILLDFGAARRVINDRTQSLTAILKPSYAPIEQYAEMTALRQGPWTDLYALGAVMHYLVFGVPPAPSTARAVQPDAEQIEHRVVPGVSPRFMSAMAWMLGVRPLDRPQNVASLRAALNGETSIAEIVRREMQVSAKAPPRVSRAEEATQAFARTTLDSPKTPLGAAPRRTGVWFAAALAAAVAGLVLWKFVGVIGDRPGGPPVAQATSAASPPPAVTGSTDAPVVEVATPSAAIVQETATTKDVPISTTADAASLSPPPPREKPMPRRESRAARDPSPVQQTVGPATAREACGKRGFIGMAMCLQRECGRPRFASDPECVQIQRDQQRRASP